jgi:aldehyde dehydrogenase (NAD+)
MTAAVEQRQTLVGGSWQDGSSRAWFDVTDPADTRQVIARVPALSAADVEAACTASERGAARWRDTNALSRGAILLDASRVLRDRADEIATELVRENGKTINEARVEVTKTADFFEFYGGLARHPYGYLLNDGRPGTLAAVRYEPVGVVVAITPWNDPLLTPARKLAPALACGNAVVLKPATDTPLVALRLARALLDAGLPPEVLTVVTGRGAEVSGPLLSHPAVAAVTFTGSTEVGLRLQRDLAGRNIRIQTEMGGKNASVVLADADLGLAVQTITTAAFAQGGQRCTATSRVIVERAVASEVEQRLAAAAAALEVGPGLEATTTIGPLASAGHRDDVLEHIRVAREDGAVVRAGGGAPSGEVYTYGCYVEPTVLTNVHRQMRIWSDEVFGPVIAVHVVDGFAEALDAVNDSDYGLSAAVFTRSLEAAHRFIDGADVGQVAVNLPTSGWDVHQPFGGFGDSGSAFKEQGLEALRFYTRVKTSAMRFM